MAADPLTEVAIRRGHRELLDTLRELAFGTGNTSSGDITADARAVLAFLRESVMPFAAWEERSRERDDPIADDTAFEHAFLAAEIDALARLIDPREDSRTSRMESVTDSEIRRRLHRIEAVLEFHTERVEDREVVGSAPNPAGDSSPATVSAPVATSPATRALDDHEVAAFLHTHSWGILSTIGDGIPYGVPVAYGWNGRSLYLAAGPGRKLRNLLENPVACLTVVEVLEPDRWCSVVVTGRAVPVAAGIERATAGALLWNRSSRGHHLSARDLGRFARARIFRIESEERTGRASGWPEVGDQKASPTQR